MNKQVTTIENNPASIMVHVEPIAIRSARKNIGTIFSAFSTEIQFDVAKMFDLCLCVDLADAVALNPVITSVNVERFLSMFKEVYDFGSTVEVAVAKLGSSVNTQILKEGVKEAVYQLDPNYKHNIPLIISGHIGKDSAEGIKAVCTYVGNRENALSCLVFHYGLRYNHAVEVYDYYSGSNQAVGE